MQDLRHWQGERNNYDDEPVLYCKSCLSLNIRDVPNLKDSDYCESCGSTNIGECSIEEWEELYKARYGKSFVDKRK